MLGGKPSSVLLIALVLLAGCFSSNGDSARNDVQAIPTGEALRKPGSAWTYEPGPMPIGQEFIFVFMTLRNGSDDVVQIRDIELVESNGVPSVMEVKGVDLIPRVGRGGSNLPMGTFLTQPPVVRHRGSCVAAGIHPSKGYELEPDGPDALVATWFRAVAPGKARFKSQRVTYEQDGNLYQQELPLSMRVKVAEGADPRPEEKWEKQCGRLPGVRSLTTE